MAPSRKPRTSCADGAQARALKNRLKTRKARTISWAFFAILAWYDNPISTGRLEGINNKVKVMKQLAYGHQDDEVFGLRLLFIHEAKFRLPGA